MVNRMFKQFKQFKLNLNHPNSQFCTYLLRTRVVDHGNLYGMIDISFSRCSSRFDRCGGMYTLDGRSVDIPTRRWGFPVLIEV